MSASEIVYVVCMAIWGAYLIRQRGALERLSPLEAEGLTASFEEESTDPTACTVETQDGTGEVVSDPEVVLTLDCRWSCLRRPQRKRVAAASCNPVSAPVVDASRAGEGPPRETATAGNRRLRCERQRSGGRSGLGPGGWDVV